MNSIRSEWPLLVFTTGAPLCAGAWVVACVLVLLDAPQAGVLTMDACGVALCLLLAASLACSTLHLGKPVKALRAFRRLGNSTVSNEVFMGTLFAAFSMTRWNYGRSCWFSWPRSQCCSLFFNALRIE